MKAAPDVLLPLLCGRRPEAYDAPTICRVPIGYFLLRRTRMPSNRLLKTGLFSIVVVAVVMLLIGGQSSAQKSPAQPSTSKGDWPYYFADAAGSRYSPQDQI